MNRTQLSDKVQQLLEEAAKGGFAGSGDFAPNGAFFVALKQATNAENVYNARVAEYVQSRRAAYTNRQDKLIDMLVNYDNWRKRDAYEAYVINVLFNPPTNNLVARIGDKEWYGEDAEKLMWRIVLTEQAKHVYETGTMPVLATPTPSGK